MNAVDFCARFVFVVCLLLASLVSAADELQTILLSKPRMEGGKRQAVAAVWCHLSGRSAEWIARIEGESVEA
jgi:hypothetical protein